MRLITFACLTLIGACGLPETQTMLATDPNCADNPGQGCHFDRDPLLVDQTPVHLPGRPYAFFPTSQAVSFVDAQRREWIAPAQTLTDGASIPPIFVSIVGQPTAPEYILAAALHDAYCGVGNEAGTRYHSAPWQDVHLMFYNGLITGGTPAKRAKVMFAAVWLGGPRWRAPEGQVPILSTQGGRGSFWTRLLGPKSDRGLAHVPVFALQRSLSDLQDRIEDEDPSLDQLVAMLAKAEAELNAAYPAIGRPAEAEADEPALPVPTPDPTPDGGGAPIDPGDLGTGDLGTGNAGEQAGGDPTVPTTPTGPDQVITGTLGGAVPNGPTQTPTEPTAPTGPDQITTTTTGGDSGNIPVQENAVF